MRTTIPMLSLEDEALLRLLLRRADVAEIGAALDVSEVEAAVLRSSLFARLRGLPIDLFAEIVGRLLPPEDGAVFTLPAKQAAMPAVRTAA